MANFQASLRKKIIWPAVFNGSGLDDLTPGGLFTGTASVFFTVAIDNASSSPNTFKWKKGSGTYTTGVNCSTTPITLSDGVTIKFGALTGHTLGDTWSILAEDSVDAVQSANGEELTIVDNSNYSTNTETGHGANRFFDYRKLYIYKYGETTKTTITSTPHWNSVTGAANTDTYSTPISIDDVYELELVTVPTWHSGTAYAINDCVYYGALLYKATGATTPGVLPSLLTQWAVVAEADLPTEYYAKNNTIALVYNIYKCEDEKVYDKYQSINNLVNSQFSIDESAVNIWKIQLNIRAIEIAVSLEEWSRAQQTIKDTTDLCNKCLTKTCAC
tara:strand:+ start:12300 stop:13292 length:993 start_codon:yes stop_codon:yes gene_type:complete